MKIAIVGAGFAGLSSAKVLTALGHAVTVYERTPDVGGVWSRTRRYPGLKTQNNKGTYRLSDHPMPKFYPQWLRGEQVNDYLQSYVERFGLAPVLRLGTEVASAVPTPAEDGWTITTADGDCETFEHLVVANGIFSEPVVPEFDGRGDFERAGGRVLDTGQLRSLDEVDGKNVLMVGYGKSACDVAVEVSSVATSTTVAARAMLWKVPRYVAGFVNYKYLLMSRFGEALFRYQTLRGLEKLLHARDSKLADGVIGSLQKVIARQLRLKRLGLLPGRPLKTIAKTSISLATEGFYEAVAEGKIDVRRETEVVRLFEKDGEPWAELSDGTRQRADLVICGCGFTQRVPFLPAEVQDRITDENGNFQLYRQIKPVDVPNLTFAGYNSSFFSPLSAEMSAVWIGSYLAGQHTLPPGEEMRRTVRERVDWMEERTDGHSARGTFVVPFSVHNIDEVLDDVGLNVSPFTKVMQWLLPVRPGAYKKVTAKLAGRVAAKAS